jgi:small-conductance mechanosensitive channel
VEDFVQFSLNVNSALRIATLILIGVPGIFWISRRVRAHASKRLSPQQGMMFGIGILYLGLALIAVSVMMELKFPLTHLLGAAGVLGIALGFASQTSVSNIISGLFLLSEKPFVVGDIVAVAGITGEVLSVDMLSIKIRTFDNKLVRIPNETIIKAELTNMTRFPIRRVDLEVGVAYKENLARVREVMLDVAHNNPLCLEEPEPLVLMQGYGTSSIDMLFAVWALKSDWRNVKNQLFEQIKERFDKEGIEIPFPHLSLYSGLATQPIPVVMKPEASDAGMADA